MNELQPIYTEKAQCQDCYKCLRACPFKAIRVLDGRAAVIPEQCILCGRCTEVCPVGAKKIRDDLFLAKQLIKGQEPVYASLAPSFRTEFSGLSEEKLISALMRIGFTGVSETALGAQEVSLNCASIIDKSEKNVIISSACPSAVYLIQQYFPVLVGSITPVISPLQAHSKMLKSLYGNDIKIIFFGPCIAKKKECEGFFDYALTFSDLRRWFNQSEIDWTKLDSSQKFVPKNAGYGSIYPLDGGMNKVIEKVYDKKDVLFMSFSGVNEILEALDNIDKFRHDKKIFIEALICSGGCVNGPAVSDKGSTVRKRYNILQSSTDSMEANPDFANDLAYDFKPREIKLIAHSKADIASALLRIGKKRFEEELNCGGCGYNTCREFASALLEEKAEPAMCVSYLRKLAQNKAAALIKAMPSGVVIVDDHLRIIESNQRFINLIGGHADIVSVADPNLEGVFLDKLVPFFISFKDILSSGSDVKVEDIRYNNKILRLTVFSIQPHHVVGGILQDITEPVIQRERIIEKAKEVMKKNLTTVQKIAFLLGENAAESEVLLSSIIESFSHKE